MLFKRREPATLLEQVRVLLWPRRSWDRSLKYVGHRLMRIRATPHQLALGFAVGVFASLSPLVGIQMILAGAIALALRANFAAAMLGTFFGNPLIWAIFWPLTYWVGCLLIGAPGIHGGINFEQELSAFWTAVGNYSPSMILSAGALIWPFFKPMLIGTIPVGFAVSGFFYFICKRAALAQRERRRPLSPFGSGNPLGDMVGDYEPGHESLSI